MDKWKQDLKKNYGSKNKSHKKKSYSKGTINKLPEGYLSGGYFDTEGYLKKEYNTELASQVAKSFGEKMTNSQLRRFYGHVKTAEKAYKFSKDEKKLIVDVNAIGPFVAESKGKGNVPEVFSDFVHANIKNCTTAKDIMKGFIPHFQSVVAYFTYYFPKK